MVRITGGRLALVEEEQILDDGVGPWGVLSSTAFFFWGILKGWGDVQKEKPRNIYPACNVESWGL